MKTIQIQVDKFELTKEELLNVEAQCKDALFEIRIEEAVETMDRYGKAKTLTEFFRGGK